MCAVNTRKEIRLYCKDTTVVRKRRWVGFLLTVHLPFMALSFIAVFSASLGKFCCQDAMLISSRFCVNFQLYTLLLNSLLL